MKNNSIGALIAKIVVALLAVAGAVYVIVAYGDKIVAWVKKVAATLPCFKGACSEGECVEEAAEEAPAEDAVVAEESEFQN